MSLIRARHFNNLRLFCDGSPFSSRLSLQHFCCYYYYSNTITTTTIITICTSITTNILTNNSITTTRICNYTITYITLFFILQATLVTISIISGQSSRHISCAWINFSFFIFFNTYKFFDSIMEVMATDEIEINGTVPLFFFTQIFFY